MRADFVLIFLICLFGGSCLYVPYLTLRKGRGAASFGLIFSGLLLLMIAGVFSILSFSLPD
jgi:hypothetical protein